MRLIFCSDPFSPIDPDSAYLNEAQAADSRGIPYELFSYEALVNENNSEKAVRRISQGHGPETAIYRGWMLTPEQYAQLYEALLSKNIELINDPAAYKHCHYLPESYDFIAEHSPRTVWLPLDRGLEIDRIMKSLEVFGSSPVIVKDYVKSRKHEWFEACFIASASSKEAVERTVSRFLELQGEDLQGGLVFREFVLLEPLATHSKSGMPLTREYRIFFVNGDPLYWVYYWEEGEYNDEILRVDQFIEVGKRVQSKFFTMDVARRSDGKWIIIELGDGQVAGLPERADVNTFYGALLERLQ